MAIYRILVQSVMGKETQLKMFNGFAAVLCAVAVILGLAGLPVGAVVGFASIVGLINLVLSIVEYEEF